MLFSGESKVYSHDDQKQIMYLGDRHLIQDIPPQDNIYLVFCLEAKSDCAHYWQKIWGMFKLFDRSGDLISGRHKVSFYQYQLYDIFKIFDDWSFIPVENVFLNFRVSIPFNYELDQKRVILPPENYKLSQI